MLINLRNALMSGKRWKNPYVTNGLVAMWDGEWNAGGGVHDPNATTWRDCVQGYVATTTDTAYTWGSNYCTSPSFRFYCPTSVGEIINAATRSKAFTIECVYSSPDQTNNVIAFAICNGSNIYDRIDFNNSPNNCLTCNFNNTETIAYEITPIVTTRFTSTSRFVFTPADPAGVDVSIKNATTDINLTKAKTIPDTVRSITEFTLGRPSFVTTKNTKFNRIAFYSRALTASEIAANYAIDKERFNLP